MLKALLLFVSVGWGLEVPPVFTTRRAMLATTMLPGAAWAESWAGGVYADPNHPRGERRITVDGSTATVTGFDDPGDKPWQLQAHVDDDVIILELQGPVQPPNGVTIESIDGGPLVPTFRGRFDPPNAILWPDGNRWTKQ